MAYYGRKGTYLRCCDVSKLSLAASFTLGGRIFFSKENVSLWLTVKILGALCRVIEVITYSIPELDQTFL